MKKILLLFFGLFLSNLAFAQKGQQAIGIQGNVFIIPYHTKEWIEIPSSYGFSSGFYYDWNFGKNFGISIAPSQLVTIQEWELECWTCIQLEPEIVRQTFHYFDFPVNLNLKLASKETAAWKTYFNIGYAYSYLYLANERNLTTKTVENADLRWYNRHSHSMNFGVEVRHNFSKNYTLGLGPSVRISMSEEIGYPIPAFNFKVGRIL